MGKTKSKEELNQIGYGLYERREQLTAQLQEVGQQIALVRNEQIKLQQKEQEELEKIEEAKVSKLESKKDAKK